MIPAGVPRPPFTSETRATGGGTVTQSAMDTPFGRLAGLADPTGARFKLVG